MNASRQECVEHIKAQVVAVVESLLDASPRWPHGRWLAAAEQEVQHTMTTLAGTLLQVLIDQQGTGHTGQVHVDEDGCRWQFKEYRTRQVKTRLGTVNIRRANYRSVEAAPRSSYPLDARLGLTGDCSEGLQDVLAFTAAQLTYEQTQQLVHKLLGVSVSVGKIQGVASQWGQRAAEEFEARLPTQEPHPHMAVAVDGVMVRTAQRRAKAPGSRKQHFVEHWREAKLAAVFGVDPHHGAQRTKHYTAALDGKEAFARKLTPLLQATGAYDAQTLLWLGDGAEWIWTLRQEIAPQAVAILDFHHACERLWTMAHAVWGTGSARAARWVARQQKRFKNSQAQRVIQELGKLLKDLPPPAQPSDENAPCNVVASGMGYFQNNLPKMDYKRYRRLGYPIGSGVVESACRHVVALRMKITTGMSWTEATAEAVLLLRCLVRSGHWDDFWRTGQLAA